MVKNVNARYDAATNMLVIELPVTAPEANANGTLMIAKVSGQKFAVTSEGKTISGNVQMWVSK